MLGVTGVPSMMQFIAFLFLPETPRWLVRNGMEDDATKVLQRIMGQTNVGKDIQLIKDICQEEIRQHQQLQGLFLILFKWLNICAKKYILFMTF